MTSSPSATDPPAAALTLDAKGLTCPMPLLKAKKAIATIGSNQVLEVLSTENCTRDDLANWCAACGHELSSEIEDNDFFRFFIKKK